ncbi:MAG: NMD3-related protein [archaeon]|nr:hypothetical protein [Nanoarchaeota archaeon]
MVRDVSDKHPLYYEAKLQIRQPTDEVLVYVEKEITQADIYIAKVDKVKNGFDYYLADNNFTKSLGKHLQEKFGGELNLTSSLFSKKDGKDIFRVTILFRKASVNKGDLVMYGGDEYKVKSMGKDITIFGIKNKKKLHIKYKDMHLLRPKED